MTEKKPARELTTEEMAARLFPPAVREHIREVAKEPKKKRERKSSQTDSKGE